MYDEYNKKLFEEYDPNKFSFEHPTGYKIVTMWGSTTYGTKSLGVGNFGGNWITHINFIAQSIVDGWTRFMLDKSYGFTRAGIERINDSIRRYIYCLLGAQVQVGTSIIGQSGISPDAEKQFIKNFKMLLMLICQFLIL